jgi:hypothetical protein
MPLASPSSPLAVAMVQASEAPTISTAAAKQRAALFILLPATGSVRAIVETSYGASVTPALRDAVGGAVYSGAILAPYPEAPMFAAHCLALVCSTLAPANPVTPPKAETPLAGRWLLTMPAGFEYDAVLEPGGEPGVYLLKCGATNLQGVYELKGRTLTLVEGDSPNLVGMTWKLLNDNAVVLADHPQKVGSDYRGATLGRQKAADPRQPGMRGPRTPDRR